MPPSPCRVLMISKANALTSSGFSAANSGLKPLNSTVRSRAGWVWRSGIVPFSVSRAARPGALGERDVALADQVAVADLRLGAHRERAVGVDGEGDLASERSPRSVTATAVDLADPHAGDADVVALQQPGGVGEQGRYGVCRRSRMLPMVAASSAGREHRDDDEDDQLDQRGSGLHDCPTAVPRAIGPNSSVARSGTCVGRDAHLRGRPARRRRACSSALPDRPLCGSTRKPGTARWRCRRPWCRRGTCCPATAAAGSAGRSTPARGSRPRRAPRPAGTPCGPGSPRG